MALGDNLIDLKAKEHFIDEIERKQREIDDLRIAIDMNYQKLISVGTLEGTLEGDSLIEEVENILNKIELMNEECIDTKIWINNYQ